MDDSEKISAVSEQPEAPAPAMKSASAHRVWLIDEGHAGHRVQSEGILNALRSLGLALYVTSINCTPTLRGYFAAGGARNFSAHKGRERADIRQRYRAVPSAGHRATQIHYFERRPNRLCQPGSGLMERADWFSVVMSPISLPAPSVIAIELVANTVTAAGCQTQEMVEVLRIAICLNAQSDRYCPL